MIRDMVVWRGRYASLLMLLLLAPTLSQAAGCLERLELGDPAFIVIERCGQPERRERYEQKQTRPVEVLRGNTSLQEYPVPPRITEKWYYEATLDAASVITIEDSGVVRMERLIREGSGGPHID